MSETHFCSFCRKSQDQVKRLISGARHSTPSHQLVELSPFGICDECLAELVSIMGEADKE